MYYALVLYPRVDKTLIDEIRRKYDPPVDVIGPHVTVLFPVPERVGEEQLVAHIQHVLRDYARFEVSLGGFHKSPDHWLFLTLQKGGRGVKELYRALYTGVLAEFRRDDIAFVPHVGLGLFLKEGSSYAVDNPQECDFDAEKYETALREAEAIGVDWSSVVETLHLVKIPDEVLEWASGERPSFSKDARVVQVRTVCSRRTARSLMPVRETHASSEMSH